MESMADHYSCTGPESDNIGTDAVWQTSSPMSTKNFIFKNFISWKDSGTSVRSNAIFAWLIHDVSRESAANRAILD
jgi:hypothetical protein